jgi:hypothetical protein
MHSGVHREINTGKTQAAMHLNYAVHHSKDGFAVRQNNNAR